jgi:hypothetical protein
MGLILESEWNDRIEFLHNNPYNNFTKYQILYSPY